MNGRPIITLTAGDVAGIGPEVIVRALNDPHVRSQCRPLVIGHPHWMARAQDLCAGAERLELFSVTRIPDRRESLSALFEEASDRIVCLNPSGDMALAAEPGVVSVAAGDAAYQYLITAIQLAQTGVVDGICTAPLNKAALHAAGHMFPGHTEILAHECGVKEFGMMLHLPESRLAVLRNAITRPASTAVLDAEPNGSSGLSVAHVTLHTSIESVPRLLTTDGVVEKVRLLNSFLEQISCDRRAIGVCALNPHGGEDGLFGDEERRIIAPAVQICARAALNVHGPLPVDTLIRRAVTGEFDGVVAMYHDQGHIPVKLMGFDAAVNISLGLPLIRTSPTHGTAFDRAWNPQSAADPAGMIEAILMAAQLCSAA